MALSLGELVDPELPPPRQVVLHRERAYELAVLSLKDVDLIDALKPAPRARDAEPLAAMRTRAPEVTDYLLVIGDQFDDLHLKIWERALKRADPALGNLLELARRELVEDIEVPLTDGLVDQPARTNRLFCSLDILQLTSSMAFLPHETKRRTRGLDRGRLLPSVVGFP